MGTKMNEIIEKNSDVLVRMPNWIGDAVMATAALEMLHDLRPDLKLIVLLKPWVQDVIKNHPAVSEVIVYNPGRFPGRIRAFFKMVKQIRKRDFSTAVLFQQNFESALLAYAGGIPVRIGRPNDLRRMLLNYPVHLSEDAMVHHQVEQYLAIAQYIVGQSQTSYRPQVFLTDHDREEATAFIERLPGNGPIIPVAPGAAFGSAKRWPPDLVTDFLNAAVRRWNARVVFLGGRLEKTVSDEILAGASERGFSMAADYSIMAQAALIEKAGICVSNDSGMMHVAAALKSVVTIALFGPTNPLFSRPYGERHIVLHHQVDCWPCKYRTCPMDHRCMRSISVEEVLDTVETALRKR
ncbi:MAG: lipopolysaccharide heptosyltransferase II [bacterium]